MPTVRLTSPCCPPGAVEEEPKTLERSIEARLDKLSEQMDAVLAEVMGLKNSTPPSPGGAHPAPRATVASRILRVLPGLRTSQQSVASRRSRSSRLSTRSDRTEVTVMSTSGGLGPPRATLHTGRSGRNTRAAAPRSMDLEIAWRLHANAKDDDQDHSMKPLLRLVERSRSEMLWELLDDPSSSRTAWWVSQILKGLVILSLFFSSLQTSEEELLDATLATVVESAIDSVFLVEFLCRIMSAPLKRNYIFDPLNWADMLSALGLPLRASIGFVMVAPRSPVDDFMQHLLLFFLPIVRFCKLLRYFESFRLLIDACGKSAEALPVLVYLTGLIVLVSATGIYLVEPRSSIPSMHHSLWLALVTMTTVGYGDYFPTSLPGYLIASALTFVSVLFLALPVGIIGHEFTMSWQSRTQVLLMTRFRKSLNKYGYGAADLRTLIEYVDVNGDGELEFDEFVELINQMRIGISRDQAALLFGIFDVDQDGVVEHKEFLKHLFPLDFVKTAGRGRKTSMARVSEAVERVESAIITSQSKGGAGDSAGSEGDERE